LRRRSYFAASLFALFLEPYPSAAQAPLPQPPPAQEFPGTDSARSAIIYVLRNPTRRALMTAACTSLRRRNIQRFTPAIRGPRNRSRRPLCPSRVSEWYSRASCGSKSGVARKSNGPLRGNRPLRDTRPLAEARCCPAP